MQFKVGDRVKFKKTVQGFHSASQSDADRGVEFFITRIAGASAYELTVCPGFKTMAAEGAFSWRTSFGNVEAVNKPLETLEDLEAMYAV